MKENIHMKNQPRDLVYPFFFRNPTKNSIVNNSIKDLKIIYTSTKVRFLNEWNRSQIEN